MSQIQTKNKTKSWTPSQLFPRKKMPIDQMRQTKFTSRLQIKNLPLIFFITLLTKTRDKIISHKAASNLFLSK